MNKQLVRAEYVPQVRAMYNRLCGIAEIMKQCARKRELGIEDLIEAIFQERAKYLRMLPRLTRDEREFLHTAYYVVEQQYSDVVQMDWLKSGLLKRRERKCQ